MKRKRGREGRQTYRVIDRQARRETHRDRLRETEEQSLTQRATTREKEEKKTKRIEMRDRFPLKTEGKINMFDLQRL